MMTRLTSLLPAASTPRRWWLMLVVALLAHVAVAQVPDRPDPPRLVNDLAGVLGDTQALEDSLEQFAMETSNQICVVTLNDLGGYDKAYMAYLIGQKWGVGKKGNNNGIVILIKPKTEDSKGDAFIATGYGLEGGLTDATNTRIVNQVMIPHFKENDYRGGVEDAVRVIKGIARGEFDEEDYVMGDDLTTEDIITILLFMAVFFFFIYMICKDEANRGGGTGGTNSRNTGTWGGPIIFGGSGPSWGSGGSWSGGSSGPSWGGFGGGSFGGGGGGGSW